MSSGISVGIDMILDFVSDRFGKDKAIKIDNNIEHTWNMWIIDRKSSMII